jgi:crotonobetainyl-CoA:carnitine CoA-transferase CaiB-like acyl-CoA transferase
MKAGGSTGAPPDAALLDPECLVVELGSRVGAGLCGTLLADLGATVVLADEPDVARHKWRGRSVVAANKRRVDRAALAPGGALAELVDRASVLLLSSDLDPDQRALWDGKRPRAQIICDVTGFGHTGPLADRACSDALVEAAVGTVDTTGLREGPPALTGAPFVEMETAVYAASAVLAALRVLREHGFGQRIDVAVYDVGVNALATFIPLPLTGRVATRNGNRHPGSSPWNSFAARDGALIICAPTDDQWRRLSAAMGRPDLADDPRFATPAARLENVTAIDAEIGAWTSRHTVAECEDTLMAHVLPVGPIVPFEDLPQEPNIVHRAAIDRVVDPVTGREEQVLPSPIRLAGEARRPALLDAPGSASAWAEAALARQPAAADRVTGDEPSDLRPLEGVSVIEIGMNTVGPLASRQLGALGADVVKVEPPTGDTNRYTPPLRGDGSSYIYAISNTDKRGIVLDLKDPDDAERLWALIDTADVLIENLKPGSLVRLGFGAEAVRERRPELVYCSINGFGHLSAYPGRPALDTVVQAMAGAMSVTPCDGQPTKSGLSLADQLGGQFGLLGVLAALDRRARTGAGATLDLAMHDCAAWATQLAWNDAPPRDGRVVPSSAHGGGYVVVDASADDAMPVLDVTAVLEHPHTRARGLTPTRTSVDGDEWLVLESPLRLLSTPARVGAPMARLGYVDPTLEPVEAGR